ncbi:pentapeptide repeat-containing protein [Solirubrobacter sp. CPCC 204708]|uniref:Pentapeptide repeat-containing protein n=1 Tax=Solirubrobacter deserti TaxID=2282478 RepID=A0ABT4RNQ2_9ACTN|nr:pentapeptide repeat-containing protein [Solirubrobacter deserti]MBE2318360.1 pentapeptide repeat-containing protein [Solirubrobacter deserti]MDA0140120.1 pentapeptide repeat-containing protein [Solirubrobacter deserti]
MSIGEIDWRGPRPLREGDELLGRAADLRELVDRCETWDVIRITARSGVGKTSFITAGGRQALMDAGYHVPIIQRWTRLLANPRVRELDTPDEIARALYLLVIGADVNDGRRLTEILEEVSGGGEMAVILDQMEELLRYQEAVGAALLRLAGTTARDSRVPQIVIARSEYAELLDPVEVRDVHTWPMKLKEITGAKTLGRIVTVPVEAVDGSIGQAEVERIVGWWTTAHESALMSRSTGAGLAGGVGLLHLQALLWSLRDWGARHGVSKHISAQDLERFVAARAAYRGFDASDEEALGRHLIGDAVVAYVDDTVAALTADPTVTRDGTPTPLTWRNGPRLMLSRIAPALSSGGYKVPQARSSLIPLALGAELTQSGARAVAELSSADDLTDLAQRTRRLAGAGVGADWDRPRLLREMLDALDAVLEALRSDEANLLRVFDAVKGESIYELVHDGIGPALTRWAQEYAERPVSTVNRIVAEPGGAILHSLSPETFEEPQDLWDAVVVEEVDGRKTAVLDELRWQSNYIGPAGDDERLELRDLVVRRADFTGAAFVACDLVRVRFEDCRFTGAVFLGCTLADVEFAPEAASGDKLDLLTFVRCETWDETGVTFTDLQGTTGLFLTAVSGGTWHFAGGRFSHLVGTAAAPAKLVFDDVTVRHVTAEGQLEVIRDGEPVPLSELT